MERRPAGIAPERLAMEFEADRIFAICGPGCSQIVEARVGRGRMSEEQDRLGTLFDAGPSLAGSAALGRNRRCETGGDGQGGDGEDRRAGASRANHGMLLSRLIWDGSERRQPIVGFCFNRSVVVHPSAGLVGIGRRMRK